MIIEERKITVGEVCEGYFNDAEEGVVGYNERLDIRPKYQREFVYKDAQRDEVIRTVLKGLPLNVIYWCKTGEDTYEVLDGQQRTISLCEYVDGSFSVDDKYFYNLPADIKKKILDYPLFVYALEAGEQMTVKLTVSKEQLMFSDMYMNKIFENGWFTVMTNKLSKRIYI